MPAWSATPVTMQTASGAPPSPSARIAPAGTSRPTPATPAGATSSVPRVGTCKGFTSWGRCKHQSLLLSKLGRVPEPRSLVSGLSDADLIALKADAARRHYLHGEPLATLASGELIA